MTLRRTKITYTVPLLLGCIALARGGAAIEQCGQALIPSLPFLGDSLHAICPASASEAIVEPEPSKWAPWTHRPYCPGTKYCVFTNSKFGGGESRGVSIITTEGNISKSVDLLGDVFARPAADITTRNGSHEAPWAVKDVPGKGKGVIATHTIRRGEAFMVDPASLMAAADLMKQVTGVQGSMLFATAIDQLPDPQTVLSLARSNKAATSVAEDVVKTNTFAVTLKGVRYMALFPEISRINHACKPNAHTRFSQRTLAMSAVALRDILPGEEISISYAEVGTPFGKRQHALLHNWGFRCTCSLCTASEEVVLQSDRRRTRIGQIRDEMLGLIQEKRLTTAVAAAKEMIDLVVEEELVAHLAEHYEVLARLHQALGDAKAAAGYAGLAIADLEKYGGDDDAKETIRDMREIVRRNR